MAAENGRLFKIQRDTTGAGAFVDIGYMRSKGYTVNNESVDVSNETDGRWRQLLEAAGNSSVSITGSSVWTDATQQAAMRLAASNDTHEIIRITDVQGDIVSGTFQVTSFGNSAEHNGEVSSDITLESAGDITLTPA